MIEAGLPPGILNVVNGDKEAVDTLLTDPRVLLQASDAGAHLDMMCGAAYPSETWAELVRDRGLFSGARWTEVPLFEE